MTLVDVALIALAWGVYHGSHQARIRLLIILPLVWARAIARVGVAAANGDTEPAVSLLASLDFLKNAMFFGLLLSPWGASAVEKPTSAHWVAHEKRVRRAIRIGTSWKSVRRWDNTVLIPVVFGSIILAPFTYLAAGLYYLTVVLPLTPRFRGRG